MGWSCSAKASRVMQALSPPAPFGSNEILNEKGEAIGFFEHSSREYDDGSIKGAVWRYVDPAKRVVKSGSFLINGDGKIVRFPLISSKVKALAEGYAGGPKPLGVPGAAEFAKVRREAIAAFDAEFLKGRS